MSVTLAALAELGPSADPPVVTDAILKHQLAAWWDPPDPPLALVSWTRMHGIVSLEIEGVFEQLGVDPARPTRPRSTTSSPNARAANLEG